MGKVCIRCKLEKTPDQFKVRQKNSSGGKRGELTSKCAKCMDADREYQRRKRRKPSEDDSEVEDNDDAWNVGPDTPVSSVDEFLTRLGNCVDPNAEDAFKLGMRVDCSTVAPSSRESRDRAEMLVGLIRQQTLWRWT